jgi:site-specific DNA recombinase
MKRAALYARFSTDLQSEKSVEDQFALCRAYAMREGFVVAETFEDRARSGASIFGRDGLIRLLARVREGAFDAVIVEHSDRLSRSMKDLADIHEVFTFRSVELRAVHSGGVMNTAMVGLFGLVGQMQREDGAKKVKRGMEGAVRSGRNAGGRAYGYRPVPGRKGELEIVEHEKAVVRRIFASYVSGATPRDIAGDLNREGVPAPRGGFWTAATINGNRQRGHGIILNPLYAGRIVWNRVRMVKDPETGKRVSRVNEAGDRQEVQAEHLRIIDEETWAAAQAIKASRGGERPQDRRKPRHLLSGLLRCASCGAGMSVKDKDHGRIRIVCTQAKEAGTCENRRPYYLDAIERAVVAGLRDKLSDRKAIEYYIRVYNDTRRKLASDATRNRASLEKRLADLNRQYERTLQGYIKGVIAEADAERELPALRAERADIEAELQRASEAPIIVELHPNAVREYLKAVERMDEALRNHAAEGRSDSQRALRDLVEAVVVSPPDENRFINVEVRGHLASLIGGDPFPHGRVKGGSMVAEEGLEPPTRGL